MPIQQRSSFAAPTTIISRPELPVKYLNPHIQRLDKGHPPPVKFQEIVRDGHTTIVGRIKIPTPGGHAFILRRLDTGAISLTTMFRAAFPTAPEEAEKAETSWVKLTYDTTGANKSGKARFAGTWVTPEVAESLADGYSLASLIRPLTAATPNPEAIHRKKAAAASQEARSESPTPSAAASSTPRDGPNPPKRRREASPVPSPTPVVPVTPKATVTVKSVLVEKPVEQTPSRLALNGKIVAPSPARPAPPPQTPQSVRRSTRLKSPAPSTQSSQRTLVDSPKTPKVPMPAITEDLTPGGSDETAVDEEAVSAEEAMEVDMNEDIREQKALIERLKAERAAKVIQMQKTQEVIEVDGSDEEATLVNVDKSSKSQKRAREEEVPLRFNFSMEVDESEQGKDERAVAGSSRARAGVAPERKQLAWGALAFAAGLSAITYLPNVPGFF